MFKNKLSVSRQMGFYFFIIFSFTVLISLLSLGTMFSNQNGAQLINVSGSLRMQSYRLIYEWEQRPNQVDELLNEYQASLNGKALRDLSSDWLSPADVQQSYAQLKSRWKEMEGYVRHNDRAAYMKNLDNYATHVDHFVSALQAFAGMKVRIAIGVILFSIAWILFSVYCAIHYLRQHVIHPLNLLVQASHQVEKENFHHVALAREETNELGLLSRAFTQMAAELAKLYTLLEEKVAQKTAQLSSANQELVLLYQSLQTLSSQQTNAETIASILRQVMHERQLDAIEVDITMAPQWNVQLDNAPAQAWYALSTDDEADQRVTLRWKARECNEADRRLLFSIAKMLGRSAYVMVLNKQQQQMVLMEERAIIARELHDSLAQSLTFFKIQVNLLKRNQSSEKQQAILHDFSIALDDAYSQLRELLASFRLTIQEANLTLALEHMLDALKAQTSAQIALRVNLPSHLFNAQQQVHLLQIVREAVINAIKHANATLIEVIADVQEEGEMFLTVRDNGSGVSKLAETGHYGLTIMRERTAILGGRFDIQRRAEGGTEVIVWLPNTFCEKNT